MNFGPAARRAVHVSGSRMSRLAVTVFAGSCGLAWHAAHAAPSANPGAPPDAWAVHTTVTAGRSAGPDGERVRDRVEGVRIPLPTFARPNWRLESGLDYAYTRFEYQGVDGRNRDLHRLSLPIHFGVGPTQGAEPDAISGSGAAPAVRPTGVRHAFSLEPAAASSSNVFKDPLNRATRTDFRVDAGWRVELPAEIAAAGDWGWVVGARRDHRFGGPRTYPVAGLAWRAPTGDWSAQAVFPDLRAAWHGSERAGAWFRAGPDGERWAVLSDELDGARFRYRQRRWVAAIGGSVNAWSGLHAGAELGIAFGRRHRFVDDTGTAVELSPGAAPFAGLTLEWRR